MTPTPTLLRWPQAVHLHPDVEAGSTVIADYAIDLGKLVANDPRTPLVYRDPREFFRATHITSGLRRMLEDVLRGLTGEPVDRVLQLQSPFGGGKSHTLAALFHAASDHAALEEVPGAEALPDPGAVRIAVFDGQRFDVQPFMVNGREVRTLWGALAAWLECYDLVAYHDQNRVAPGGEKISALLGNAPTLLLMDEVLQYVERAYAEPVGESNLGRLTLAFIQSLAAEVANTPHAVLVYSLQKSENEAYGNASLLQQLDHVTSRVDARREPVAGDETLLVLKRRLLMGEPENAAADATAAAFTTAITQMRASNAPDDASRRAAQDQGVALRRRFMAAYPFHPALIDIMRERWASLPDYQRTRGALRFLAVAMHAAKSGVGARYVLGPCDIPLESADVVQALFKEVGQGAPFKAVLERDFLGENSRIGRIDAALASERAELAGVNPARRIATAILAYSFGGLSRPDAAGGASIATGVTEEELLCAVVGPDLDSITAQSVLTKLREQSLYLHYDGVHYAFKTSPNVTQLLEDQAGHVTRQEIDEAIKDDLARQLGGRPAIVWPQHSRDIPDGDPRFLLAYLPLDFAVQTPTVQDQQATELLTKRDVTDRRYRNGLGLAAPDATQAANARNAAKYLKAINLVRNQHREVNLTAAQQTQLRQLETTHKNAYDSAMRRLYDGVWLPQMVGGQMQLEKVSIGARAMAATTTHERLMELLSTPPPRVHSSVTPDKVIELMKLGDAADQSKTVDVARVIDTFYSAPGFPRLDKADAIRKAIADGVAAGKFGYVRQSDLVPPDAITERGLTYLATRAAARIGAPMSESEIDTDSGVIIIPSAIESEAPPQPVAPPTSPVPTGTGVVYTTTDMSPSTPAPVVATSAAPQETVSLSLNIRNRANANVLATVLGALAGETGSVEVTVEATKPGGFRPGWVRNAVREPLEEADIEFEDVPQP